MWRGNVSVVKDKGSVERRYITYYPDIRLSACEDDQLDGREGRVSNTSYDKASALCKRLHDIRPQKGHRMTSCIIPNLRVLSLTTNFWLGPHVG